MITIVAIYASQYIRSNHMSTSTLLSPRELAISTGWPERRIRNLLNNQSLRHIKIGSNYLLPPNAIEDFIEREMFDPCQDNTLDQDLSKKHGQTPKPVSSSVASSGTCGSRIQKTEKSVNSAPLRLRLSKQKNSNKKS